MLHVPRGTRSHVDGMPWHPNDFRRAFIPLSLGRLPQCPNCSVDNLTMAGVFPCFTWPDTAFCVICHNSLNCHANNNYVSLCCIPAGRSISHSVVGLDLFNCWDSPKWWLYFCQCSDRLTELAASSVSADWIALLMTELRFCLCSGCSRDPAAWFVSDDWIALVLMTTYLCVQIAW